MKNLISKALAHVVSIHPSVVQVVYGNDLRWAYTAADGSAPAFNGQEDIGLLEDAADEAYSLAMQNTPISLVADDSMAAVMKKKVRFSNILWDADGGDSDLPAAVDLDVSFDCETDLSLEGADILSAAFGFCVASFAFEVLPYEPSERAIMKTRQQRSNTAHSAVLAHASYAGLEAETFETQLRELAIGMKVLCDEYGVDLAEAVLAANDATENAQPN